MQQQNFMSPAANTMRAFVVAGAALLCPGQVDANIPNTVPSSLSGMTKPSGRTVPGFRDTVFLGSRSTIELSYKDYPVAQVQRIVTAFLESLADKYDVQASIPTITNATTACLSSSGEVYPEIRNNHDLHQTAVFFRELAQTTSDSQLHPEVARGLAISILHGLGPFLPAEISNPDQTAAPNPAATHPDGITLRLLGKDFFTTMKGEQSFVGIMARRDAEAPEAVILANPEHNASLVARVTTFERILDLGGAMTAHSRAQHSLPDLVIMARTSKGHRSIVVDNMPSAPASRRNCVTQLAL